MELADARRRVSILSKVLSMVKTESIIFQSCAMK
jgi:hypothetical protein